MSKTYDGVIHEGNFETSPFRKIFERLFNLKLKYEKEGIDIMHKPTKLLKKSLFGERIRKDNKEEYSSKSE